MSGASVGLAHLLYACPVFAYHTEQQRWTNNTAYTHGGGGVKLGLWDSAVGIIDRLDLSTYVLPWVFNVVNLGAKYEYRASESFSLSAKASVFTLDVQTLISKSPPITVTAIPAELAASYRIDEAFTLSLLSVYTSVRVKGSLQEDSLKGAAAISNLQLVGTLEYRASNVTAFQLTTRYVAHQWQPSASGGYVMHPDDYTTVEVYGAAVVDALEIQRAFSIVPSVVWSWKHFNLQLGLGYGNMQIGGINFVMPSKFVVPEFDMFWRW